MRKSCRMLVIAAMILACVSCETAEVQKKRTEDAAIHYRMGVINFNDGKYVEALKELTEAAEKNPDDPSYHNALGLAYFARGLTDGAEREMKLAIKLDPKFSEAYVNLAAIHLSQRRWDDAITASQKALENIFYGTPELAHANIGWANFYKGDYKLSAEAFKKTVESNAYYAPGFLGLGGALEKGGDFKGAADAYGKALRLAPNYQEAEVALGLVQIKLKDNEGAVRSFEHVLEVNPETEQAKTAREYLLLIK